MFTGDGWIVCLLETITSVTKYKILPSALGAATVRVINFASFSPDFPDGFGPLVKLKQPSATNWLYGRSIYSRSPVVNKYLAWTLSSSSPPSKKLNYVNLTFNFLLVNHLQIFTVVITLNAHHNPVGVVVE